MRVAALAVATVCLTGRLSAQDAAQLIQQQVLQQQLIQQQVEIATLQAQQASQQAMDASMRASQAAATASSPRPRAWDDSIPAGPPDPSAAAIPTFWPRPGTFATGSVTVTISNETPFADVYYTTDGSVPTTRSARYSGPITLTKSGKILAIAVAPDLWQSPVAIGSYEVH